jgi:hypothetical protein
MLTAVGYRLRAKQYLELAKQSQDLYAREALAELAEESKQAAEKLERDRRPGLPSRQH